MDPFDSTLKRKSSEDEIRDTLHKFITARKKAKIEAGMGTLGESSSGPSALNDEKAFIVRISPHHLDLPPPPKASTKIENKDKDLSNSIGDYQERKSDDYERHPFFLQNLSVDDDDNEPRRLFTLYDIKNDDTSKSALEAKRRLRYTNVHGLICPQEKMFLTTACDFFQADYDELIDYVDAIGEMRNKQIIVDHCYYKLFMHTLKMFYYTDKGWQFVVEFDEFFSGYMRKYREPIINQMTTNYENAKKAAAQARKAALEARTRALEARNMAALQIETKDL